MDRAGQLSLTRAQSVALQSVCEIRKNDCDGQVLK